VAQSERHTLTSALRRYQVMADIVGVGLLLLVFVGMPLQYAAGQPVVVSVVGPIHGFAYIMYLAAAFDLSRRARLSVGKIAAMVAAGLVPFLAFYVERRISQGLVALP
jgi:integral membrane protein